jgi:hypothetical protein
MQKSFIIKNLPELYFMLICTWWFAGNYSMFFNYPAVIFFLTLLLLIFKPMRIPGLIIGGLFALGAAYLVLAMISDAVKPSEAPVLPFILKVGTFIAVTFTMSVLMLRKYGKLGRLRDKQAEQL